MKICLNDILINTYDRFTRRFITIYDDNGNCGQFTENYVPDKIKQMKVERFDIISEKLVVIKVVGDINE